MLPTQLKFEQGCSNAISMNNILFLGQVGFIFETQDARFLVDPYLSNSVEEQEDSSMKRAIPITCSPENLADIGFVLITHAHRDHCDPDTLVPIANASPQCHFYGPSPVLSILSQTGISKKRLHLVSDEAFTVKGIRIVPVPSAHPTVKTDSSGGWQAVGYIIDLNEKKYYHPGDTAVSDEVIAAVSPYAPIDVGMIPVNEINYYRNKENIIGNMSVREAFQFAEDIGVKMFIPTHWDMFAKNEVYKEEIELLYDRIQPNFKLKILDAGSTYAG